MSVPSRDFTVSREPSTASMVPRIRTGGGCCAHATDPPRDRTASEAASTRGNKEIFGMAFLPRHPAQGENTAAERLFLSPSSFRDGPQDQTSDVQLPIRESRDSPMCNCTSEVHASRA